MSIIYQPKGKAKEYSPWAANFYNGCSNKCDYCYNRHCQAKALLGKDEPTLKKSLIGDNDAVNIFKKECDKHIETLRRDGLFFNFVSDPCLPETLWVNWYAIAYCLEKKIPVTVLTKRADWLDEHPAYGILEAIRMNRYNIKIGFTLTGRDDLEQGASTNQERIYAMKRLKEEFGIYTWASIEPVIDIYHSSKMIHDSIPYCCEYRIGLLSGKKSYTPHEVICPFDGGVFLGVHSNGEYILKTFVMDRQLYFNQKMDEKQAENFKKECLKTTPYLTI